MLYKRNLPQTLDRLRELYAGRAPDRIFAACTVPSRALAEFRRRHATVECGYPDPAERVQFWEALFRERSGLEDDSLPAAYFSEFDQGLYGGLLGGDVRFMAHPENGWISSMVPPLLSDWSQLDALLANWDWLRDLEARGLPPAPTPEHPWWQRYRHQLDVFAAASRGKWGLSHFILIDSLNFVFELVGATETYLSAEECPDLVRRAVDFAYDLNVRVQEQFFATAGLPAGGTLSNFAQWIPGRIVSESIDPFHMTSVDYFERWGREPAERILARFDGGVVHIHGNGRHLLAAAATLRGLKAILLLDDRGFPSAFDVLPQLQARTGSMPLSVYVDYPAFVAALDRRMLPGGVLYNIRSLPDIDTANRLMERVRTYRTG